MLREVVDDTPIIGANDLNLNLIYIFFLRNNNVKKSFVLISNILISRKRFLKKIRNKKLE